MKSNGRLLFRIWPFGHTSRWPSKHYACPKLHRDYIATTKRLRRDYQEQLNNDIASKEEEDRMKVKKTKNKSITRTWKTNYIDSIFNSTRRWSTPRPMNIQRIAVGLERMWAHFARSQSLFSHYAVEFCTNCAKMMMPKTNKSSHSAKS